MIVDKDNSYVTMVIMMSTSIMMMATMTIGMIFLPSRGDIGEAGAVSSISSAPYALSRHKP